MTIKDLQNNKELLNSIVEDLEDFDENTEVVYEVWALGYDENDEVTDAELCLFNSTDPDEAIEYAKKVELADIIHEAGNGPCTNNNVCKIYIEVESTIQVDEEFINAGTIYKKEVMNNTVDYEPDYDEDYPEDQIVHLEDGDFEVLEDNTLKVNCFALKGFNKNDIVMFYFPKEEFPMEYKIMSRVMYEDGDYYHCELEY